MAALMALGRSMWGRRRLTEADLAAAVKGAVADATTESLLKTHIDQCERDKRELREAIARQDLDRERMHNENSAKFDRLNKMVWMAAGVVSFAVFLLSTQFGSSMLTKIIH